MNSCVISEKMANLEITDGRPGSEKGTGRQNRQVNLKMLRIDWVFKPNSRGKRQGFGDLVGTFTKAQSETLFSTNLVITLVMNFWSKYYATVVKFCLIPFLIYFTSTVVYFSHYMLDSNFTEKYSGNYFSMEFANRVVAIIGMVYFGLFEVI